MGGPGTQNERKLESVQRFLCRRQGFKTPNPTEQAMRRIVIACSLLCCVAVAAGFPAAARAQTGGVAVGFRNEMKTPVIVQGWTMVGGMKKAGMAIAIPPGKTLGEINIPAGLRFYSVHDGNMPSIVYIRDIPVPVMNSDIGFAIRG